jgi:metal-dependent amidase/aminoacylase/carboxypeptidase family protein
VEVLDLIERRMRELTQGLAGAFELEADFGFHRNYPPTVNHGAETAFVERALRDMGATVQPFEPTMGAEDFSFFLQAKPGCYFLIGNGDGAHRVGGHGLGPCTLHNPSYDFNDALIPVGGTMWVRLAEAYLNG